MSYTIRIGNRRKYRRFVDDVFLQEAPADGVPTDNTNERWPSYTGWYEFAEETGLLDMFFDKKVGIMRSRPGIFKITKDHQAQVNQAIENYGSGYQLARLKWLKFWVDWATENCENPSIQNS